MFWGDDYWRLGTDDLLRGSLWQRARSVRGIGTTIAFNGTSAPLVVIQFDPEEFRFGGFRVRQSDTEPIGDYLQQLVPLSAFSPNALDESTFFVRELLNSGTPEPLVLPVTSIGPAASRPPGVPNPPSPSNLIGAEIRCGYSHTRGTLGFPVGRGCTTFEGRMLTAGHIFPEGIGSPVHLVERRWFRPRYELIGTVAYHSDPLTHRTPGWDVALIEADFGFRQPHIPFVNGIAHRSTTITNPMPVRMYGGISGIQDAGIVGALMVFDDGPEPTRAWQDCWLMIPSAVAQQGDSGAPIVDSSTGEAIGIMVAGSYQHPATSFAIQVVQDLASMLAATPALADCQLL